MQTNILHHFFLGADFKELKRLKFIFIEYNFRLSFLGELYL